MAGTSGTGADAVGAGVYVVPWRLVRTGTPPAAAGRRVDGLGVIGRPVARTAGAVLAAVADIVAGTDAHGAGAARHGHV